MKRFWGKFHAILALALVLSLTPAAVFADDEDSSYTDESQIEMVPSAPSSEFISSEVSAPQLAAAPEFDGIVQITGGYGFSAALRNDGTVWTWGDNMRGKLGNGITQQMNRYTPAQVKGLSNVVAVAAGLNHTLAVKDDGTVWAWGQNTYGQLGTGNAVDSGVPVLVEGVYNIVSVAAGTAHSVALDKFGNVYTWGNNDKGQLGNGNNVQQFKPVQVEKLPEIKAIASGAYHVLTITKGGQIAAWGDNSLGQLGTGGYGGTDSTPTLSIYVGAVKAIAAGASFSMALEENGILWAWGSNAKGQLGNGTTKDSVRNGSVHITHDIVKIAAGTSHMIAMRQDGTIFTWGSNDLGQLGNDTNENATLPQQIIGLNNVVQFGTGSFHTMVVKKDGSIVAWGSNLAGQLGDGTTINRDEPTAVPRFTLDVKKANQTAPKGDSQPVLPVNPQSVSAGDSFSLLLKGGKLWSSGENVFGQLGDETGFSKNSWTAAKTAQTFQSVSAGQHHAAAVTASGDLWTWGSNVFGQLGDGTKTNHNIATGPVLTNVAQVASGGSFTAALKRDGTVWLTGDNTYGQLGDGTGEARTSFEQLMDMPVIVQIEAGYTHMLALDVTGTIWAWGDNTNGQLGDGTTVGKKAPVAVSGISDIVAIQAGKYHSIALGNTGNVYAWGQNFNGQLGDGTKSNHSNPGLVFDLGPVQAIAAGANHNLALQTDGTVKAWGFNQFGQLGDGSNETKSKPVSVIQGTGIKEISAGGNHSIALRADGTYAVWGAGFSGQLGLAAYTNQMVPETVTGLASMFLDMTGHWAQGAVEQAAAKGYVDGYQDGTFHPDTLVTRAEFAKMAATALGLKANPAGPGMDWFTPYVEALFLANVYGHEEVHAQWNEPITRQEIARIGVRASDKTLQKQDTAVDLKYAMLTAVKKGLLQGVDGGALGPEQPSNRAQAVTIIERILTLISGGTLSVDVNALSQAERL